MRYSLRETLGAIGVVALVGCSAIVGFGSFTGSYCDQLTACCSTCTETTEDACLLELAVKGCSVVRYDAGRCTKSSDCSSTATCLDAGLCAGVCADLELASTTCDLKTPCPCGQSCRVDGTCCVDTGQPCGTGVTAGCCSAKGCVPPDGVHGTCQ